MRYDMIPHDVVTRVMDTFYAHSDCINEKYNAFCKETDRYYSDRDRFVGLFFKKYVGKCIVLVDKILVASSYNGFHMAVDPQSVYLAGRKVDNWNVCEPIYRMQRKYLFISGFRAVNEMYGIGFVEMGCYDVFGNSVNIRLDNNNLNHMQFRVIDKSEFDSVVGLFDDDRDDVPFKVTRFLSFEEMKERKIKSKGLVQETVVVKAKDIEDAIKKTTNATEAELI